MTFDVTGEAYDRFMGRYSAPLATRLADWLGVETGQSAIDVGCGPGALTAVLAERLGAGRVAAVDPSASFVGACRERHPGVDVRVGTAESLPHDDDSFDLAVANLVVHFMDDPVRGLAEMARVTRRGCRVGATVWDLAGGRAPMAAVWRTVARLDPGHDDERHMQGGSPGELEALFTQAGLEDVEGVELEVTVTHPSFEEWWEPFLHQVGPVGEAIAAMRPEVRAALEPTLREDLGAGPFDLTAVAFAVRGRA